MGSDIRFTGGLTLQEALEMIYIDDADEIFIEPPESNVLTDEDSADEDDGGTLDNLSGRQLLSKVEIKLTNSSRIRDQEDVETMENESEENQEINGVHEKYKKECENESQEVKDEGSGNRDVGVIPEKINLGDKISWIENGDLVDSKNKYFPKPVYDQYRDISCVDIFEKFIDDGVIELLVNETRKYALFKYCPDLQITASEIRCFIAILIVSGYDQKPGKRYYWETATDIKNILVSQAMRRDRFIQIMRFVHCADNTKVDTSDKLYKLRPLMNLLQKNFDKNFVPVEHLDFDEAMIKYYGKHGCKQFIRGKPIRFGFKMWSLNTSDGYLVKFDVYQGKHPNANENYEFLFGKCTAPFVTMIDELSPPEYPYKFYLDNLFTSINLLNHMRERGYGCTGTVLDNRMPKSCPLVTKKCMKKQDRGTYISAIDRDHGIIFVKWTDNNVTAASTCHGIKPIGYVKRYNKTEKKYVQVERPYIIGQYNNHMGGTDLMDQNISTYRIGIRSKKWWWSIFTWLIDVSISNAWILYKKGHATQISQLDFRRSITQTYLKRYENIPKGAGRPSTSKCSLSLNRISDDLRYDGLNHLLMSIPDKKRRRCAGEGCSTSARTMCKKCDVGLCIDCNVIFHTKTK